jgi:hypothetical protein
MPCYDNRNDFAGLREDCTQIQRRADAATRAACEMARAIEGSDTAWRLLWPRLTLATQKWIRMHQALDERRKEEGMATKKSSKKPLKRTK